MTRYSDRERDYAFMGTVKLLACLLKGEGLCWGPVEADHAGHRWLSHKAGDDTCIPLCTGHHHARTNYTGYFYGFTADMMRAWCDAAIARTQALVEGLRVAVF